MAADRCNRVEKRRIPVRDIGSSAGGGEKPYRDGDSPLYSVDPVGSSVRQAWRDFSGRARIGRVLPLPAAGGNFFSVKTRTLMRKTRVLRFA